MAGLQSRIENAALPIPENLAERFTIVKNSNALAGPAGSTFYGSPENQLRAIQEFDFETRAFMFQQGRILFRNQDFKLAQIVARRILQLDAYDLGGLELLTDALLALGEIDQATVCARERMKASIDATAFYLKAKLDYQLNKDADAQISLASALELVDQECELLFEIYKLSGNAALRKGDVEAAEEFYHRSYRIQPASDLILVNLGTLEIQRQSWNAARMRFQDAIGLNRKNEKAWVGLAIVNREQGDNELAWGNLERSLDLKNDNLTALQLCVTWGLADGQWQRSATHLENYLSTHVDDADIAYSLSCIYYQLRRIRDADLTLERVRILKPDREGLKELNLLIQQALKLAVAA
jgi:tetratricopeptide (TPR) repeat protein